MKEGSWAPIVFGVALFVVFCAISAAVFGVSWMRDHLHIEDASGDSAEAAFVDVRQRFAAKAPLLEMRDSAMARRNDPAPDAPLTTLTTMHVLAWIGRGETREVRHSVLAVTPEETPIRFGTFATGLDEMRISLRASDIERMDPALSST